MTKSISQNPHSCNAEVTNHHPARVESHPARAKRHPEFVSGFQEFIKKILITSLLSVFISHNAYAKKIEAGPIMSSLSLIEKMVEASTSKAGELFEQNNGAKIKPINLLEKGNKTLSTLKISPEYRIQLKFQNLKNKKNTNDIPEALANVKIELRPIYNKGDSQITAWSCFTDADTQYKVITGKNSDSKKRNGLSYITDEKFMNDNEYLSSCVYRAKLF